ncbi:uncharacterized protein LOC117638997 [Thrips palmi]|uniref:Uncharacterized protein LOC117638997 n=1 Tax=Thrips palmi TaxID=161013 RepID=A0A6P8ZGI4_THRPL|nr:uncharacterized protein LOC117638997 [Thrips palmi]
MCFIRPTLTQSLRRLSQSKAIAKMTVLHRSSGSSSGTHSADGSPSHSASRPDGRPESDLLSSASSALRRLHFKSSASRRYKGKHAGNATPPIPTVVIMGSSTTSETTINTSTDSATTQVTAVTATDGETTEDSLDRGPNFVINDSRDEDVFVGTFPGTPSSDSRLQATPTTPLLSALHRKTGDQSYLFTRTEIEDDGEDFLGDPSSPTWLTSSLSSVAATTPTISPRTSTSSQVISLSSLQRTMPGTVPSSPPSTPPNTPLSKTSPQVSPLHRPRHLKRKQHVSRKSSHVADRRHSHYHPPPSPTLSVRLAADKRRMPATTTRKAPATIVVQQPSVTGNSPEGGGDGHIDANVFILDKQQLDVNSHFNTLQCLETRFGRPHHSRSQSVKTPGRSGNVSDRQRPHLLCLPQQRARVASMPNTGVEEEYYRLRHFSITGKGIVNRGDSLKSRRSRSKNSVASSNSSHSTEHIGPNGSARSSATCSLASSRDSSTCTVPYRVVMLGGAGVGKSSLVQQFMTSEYLHAYDLSLDDECGEKSVSILLDGEESELTFVDHPSSDTTPLNEGQPEPHAYCVVYSQADLPSFRKAEDELQRLWTGGSVGTKAVILVANKTDLVRGRTVTAEEGKAAATSYDCKFIETSVAINHNVDELLVGILTQIRLKLQDPERTRSIFRKRSASRSKSRSRSPLIVSCVGGLTSTCVGAGEDPNGNNGHPAEPPLSPGRGSGPRCRRNRMSASLKVRGLLDKVWARDSKSKSCENLHVL